MTKQEVEVKLQLSPQEAVGTMFSGWKLWTPIDYGSDELDQQKRKFEEKTGFSLDDDDELQESVGINGTAIIFKGDGVGL